VCEREKEREREREREITGSPIGMPSFSAVAKIM
jgi:hypothetical protein